MNRGIASAIILGAVTAIAVPASAQSAADNSKTFSLSNGKLCFVTASKLTFCQNDKGEYVRVEGEVSEPSQRGVTTWPRTQEIYRPGGPR